MSDPMRDPLTEPETRPVQLRIGSLCSGYGGLDMVVQAVLDAKVAWVADPDPGAAAILAHHHPNTPNHGDITTTDWSQVEPVDILTAGFPCQPISAAGNGRGIHDERWLFDDITQAIGRMGTRPRLCLFENSPRLLTIGGGDAMASVVHGLAALGYVGRYRVVSAADVGAPHLRRRLFILATANTAGIPQREPSDPAHAITGGRDSRPQPRRRGVHAHADTGSPGRQRPGSAPFRVATIAEHRPVNWREFTPVIQRWENVTGRPAPYPTEPAPLTGQRIAARFTEWMQGLDDGHVTAVPGLSYVQQITALGNGVVPQQGAAALRMLLEARP